MNYTWVISRKFFDAFKLWHDDLQDGALTSIIVDEHSLLLMFWSIDCQVLCNCSDKMINHNQPFSCKLFIIDDMSFQASMYCLAITSKLKQFYHFIKLPSVARRLYDARKHISYLRFVRLIINLIYFENKRLELIFEDEF